MTTWNELHRHITTTYTISGYGPHGQIFMVFDLPGGRSQSVMVARAQDGTSGEEWAKIESIVGKVGEVDVHSLLEIIRFQLAGGLAKNDDYVTVRHSIPLAEMTKNDFEAPLGAILDIADHLERSTSRQDRY